SPWCAPHTSRGNVAERARGGTYRSGCHKTWKSSASGDASSGIRLLIPDPVGRDVDGLRDVLHARAAGVLAPDVAGQVPGEPEPDDADRQAGDEQGLHAETSRGRGALIILQ